MTGRAVLRISAALVLLMLAVSVVGFVRLPADAQLPIHWDIRGVADRFAPKIIGLLFLPGVAAVLTVLFVVIPAIEPRRENLVRSKAGYQAIWVGVVVLMAALHSATVAIALGLDLSMARIVAGGVGLLFVVIGNWLPTLRSTFTVGIRTPWTLTSERSWVVTHRIGGRAFVLVGLATVVLAVSAVPLEVLAIVLLGGTAATVALAVVVSYRTWAGDPERSGSSLEGGAS